MERVEHSGSMVRRVVVVACAVALAAALAVTAHAASPPNGGQAVDACRSRQGDIPSVPGVVTPGPAACRNVAQFVWGAARACRVVDNGSPQQCEAVDGRAISPADLRAYQSSWVHRALTLQRGIDLSAPLFESVVPHTHNTFNSSAYGPTLTNQDPNQVYSITDQLNMDIRLIEMDLHWVPSIYGNPSTGGKWVTLCHGDSGNPLKVHIGCTNDRPFQDGLAEVKAWLAAHPGEFLVVYLENQLSGDPAGHQLAGRLINAAVGSIVDRPTTPCAPMDWSRSRASMLAVGTRVAFVGNCDKDNGLGTAWAGVVHARGPRWDESGGPDGYDGKTCAADEGKHAAGVFRRYFEDSTWLAAMVGSNGATDSLGGTTTISAAQTAAMVRCGVNIIGFDQLTPTDPRLAALVWSWAPNEPLCQQRKPFACVDAAGGWHVTAAAKRWASGFKECAKEFPGSTFAVPVNGYRNAQLRAAKGPVADVWLAYSSANGAWRLLN